MKNLKEKEFGAGEMIWSLIQLMFFAYAVANKDWFFLAVVYVMNTNTKNIVLWRGRNE